MSRIRTRLEQYKKELERQTQYKAGLPGSALNIVNALLSDLEQDEKENGWIPVNERMPETQKNYEECYLVTDGIFCWMAYWTSKKKWIFADCTNCKSKIDWTGIVAWRPLPEPYKED